MISASHSVGDAGGLAILVSGGLDSAILLGRAVADAKTVHPLYVRAGHIWESVEFEHLQRYLNAIAAEPLRPLSVIELPIGDLLPNHWSLTGRDVPDASSPDEAVFLPGRNVLLLSKAMLWCHLHGVNAVAMANLESNPFPDATPAFFREFEGVVNRAIGGHVRVLRPFATLHKREVMLSGQDLPLGLTFSCIRPVGKLHCGRCNKCAERITAFRDAEMIDPTIYASGRENFGSFPTH